MAGDAPTPTSMRTPWKHKLAQWDISHFAIPLALAAFTAMWKSVCTAYVIKVPPVVYITFWCIALSALTGTLLLYFLRAVVWPGGVVWDFQNPRLVNFFFVPVIVGTLLVLGCPPGLMFAPAKKGAFYTLAGYQGVLAIYLYGEWLFGKALIDVVHPVVFMQVIGWFLLGNIAASLMLVEQARALIAVGVLFWLLVFVTNFQHTSSALTKRHEKIAPTFFLFIAPPAQAAIALAMLAAAAAGRQGRDGMMVAPSDFHWPAEANIALYIDLFLYLIIFRLFPTFWTQKFAVVWWAYIFPLSAVAGATLSRCKQTDSLFWPILSGLLVSIASVALGIVVVSTFWGVTAGRLPNNPPALAAFLAFRGQLPNCKEGASGELSTERVVSSSSRSNHTHDASSQSGDVHLGAVRLSIE